MELWVSVVKRVCLFFFATFSLAGLLCGPHQINAESPLVGELSIGVENPLNVRLAEPPRGLVADKQLGLLRHRVLKGQVLHTAKRGLRGLFETRGVRTPKGDLLLMFPEGNHYAAGSGKVNDMIAYRSSDNGKTWEGPSIAFDIDYSQHGFIPQAHLRFRHPAASQQIQSGKGTARKHPDRVSLVG